MKQFVIYLRQERQGFNRQFGRNRAGLRRKPEGVAVVHWHILTQGRAQVMRVRSLSLEI